MIRGVVGCVPFSFGKHFAEPHNPRSDTSAARTSRWFHLPAAFRFIGNGVRIDGGSPTGKAEGTIQLAVQVQHIATAGPLVQVIHVLGNHRQSRHPCFKGGNCKVCGIWLRTHHFHSSPFIIEVIHAAAANDVAAVETDIDGQRSLIRDRSFLAVRNIGDRVKASAEFVLGLGPEKTLQRGFVLARHRDGKPVTRKAQLGAGERIELQFADGQVGAVTE